MPISRFVPGPYPPRAGTRYYHPPYDQTLSVGGAEHPTDSVFGFWAIAITPAGWRSSTAPGVWADLDPSIAACLMPDGSVILAKVWGHYTPPALTVVP